MKLAPEAQLYLQLRASLNLPDLRMLSPKEGRRISEETSRRWQLSDPPAVESVEQRSCDGPNGPVPLRIYRPMGGPKEGLPGLGHAKQLLLPDSHQRCPHQQQA